ncbi:hypothetical protein VNO77_14994 [Canavalia gladiata]|uniref:Uncharacterized protein n=1 Tax=Canavalia gladiata TaxID=3824 RepID=A0AAN9LZ58_CANGL
MVHIPCTQLPGCGARHGTYNNPSMACIGLYGFNGEYQPPPPPRKSHQEPGATAESLDRRTLDEEGELFLSHSGMVAALPGYMVSETFGLVPSALKNNVGRKLCIPWSKWGSFVSVVSCMKTGVPDLCIQKTDVGRDLEPEQTQFFFWRKKRMDLPVATLRRGPTPPL